MRRENLDRRKQGRIQGKDEGIGHSMQHHETPARAWSPSPLLGKAAPEQSAKARRHFGSFPFLALLRIAGTQTRPGCAYTFAWRVL